MIWFRISRRFAGLDNCSGATVGRWSDFRRGSGVEGAFAEHQGDWCVDGTWGGDVPMPKGGQADDRARASNFG